MPKQETTIWEDIANWWKKRSSPKPTKTKKGDDQNNQANSLEALSEKNDIEDMSKEERKAFLEAAGKTPQAKGEGCGCIMLIVFIIIVLILLSLLA